MVSELHFKIHYKWWFKAYLFAVYALHEFIVNYVDMEAELNCEKIAYWHARGMYLTWPYSAEAGDE